MRKEVRIVVVGDENVGKSSLISDLVEERFLDDVPHVMAEVSIPSEITPDHVPTFIMDTSSRPENRDALETEIHRSHVIVLIYAVNDPISFQRIRSYWLPYIKSLGITMPIILVGNKIDTRGKNMTNASLEEDMIPIMDEFKEVETCIECSAKNVMNVTEVFYFALKAVLHPTSPLYDPKEQQLKPLCIKALDRIFKLCDTNNDGFLDDIELNTFQMNCFDNPLQSKELECVKEIISEADPKGISPYGLTLSGFLTLHLLFVQRGRLETTWTVLRKFSYEDNLMLKDSFLHPKLEVPSDSSVELGPKGFQFLADLFKKFDKDNDGALSDIELKDLFSTSPGNPWNTDEYMFPLSTLTNDRGYVTLQGFLNQWIMTTILNYRVTLEYLAYFGFSEDSTTAVKVTRSRKMDRKKDQVTRDTFLCYVIGPDNAGKRSILRHFVENNDPTKPDNQDSRGYIKSTINSVDYGSSVKHLVLQSLGPTIINSLKQNKNYTWDNCDLIVFVYDTTDPTSFSQVLNICKGLKLDSIPVLVISTKNDMNMVSQKSPIQPIEFCRQRHWKVPISISVKNGAMADLYQRMVDVIMNPNSSMTLHVRTTKQKGWVIAGLFVSSAIAIGAAWWVRLKMSK